MTRILVVDDEPTILDSVGYALQREGFDVSSARDGTEALRLARAETPDVVVLDVMLPGLSGREVCRQLRAESDVPILMLSARGGEVDRVLGLELGADEFIPKPVQPRVLLAHIRAMLRRAGMQERAGAESDTVVFGRLEIDTASREVRVGGAPIDLTTAEFDVLWLLARHAGKVLSRADILHELRSLDYDGSDRSVDCRIYRLRRKLGDLADKGERIKTIRNVGYLFSPSPW